MWPWTRKRLEMEAALTALTRENMMLKRRVDWYEAELRMLKRKLEEQNGARTTKS